MASDWLFAAIGIPMGANDWLKNLIHGGDTKTVIPVLVSRNIKLGDWWIFVLMKIHGGDANLQIC